MQIEDPRHRGIYDALRLDLKIATDGSPELSTLSAEQICVRLQGSRNKAHRSIYDAACAVYCHDLFFGSLLPDDSPPSVPEGNCAEILRQSFGSTGNFFYLVRTLAASTTTPGFLWLYSVRRSRQTSLGIARLPLCSLPDLRLFKPILCIDLWEHAYIHEWDRDISGFADSCLRKMRWKEIFTNLR